jgi:hypothetical protein
MLHMWRPRPDAKDSLLSCKTAQCVLLLLPLALIGCLLCGNATQDESGVTWALCRNTEAGYELQFPAEWSVYGRGSTSTNSPQLVRETPCLGNSVSLISDGHDPLNPTDPDILPAVYIGIKDYQIPKETEVSDHSEILLDGIPFMVSSLSKHGIKLIGSYLGQTMSIESRGISSRLRETILSTFRFIEKRP